MSSPNKSWWVIARAISPSRHRQKEEYLYILYMYRKKKKCCVDDVLYQKACLLFFLVAMSARFWVMAGRREQRVVMVNHHREWVERREKLNITPRGPISILIRASALLFPPSLAPAFAESSSSKHQKLDSSEIQKTLVFIYGCEPRFFKSFVVLKFLNKGEYRRRRRINIFFFSKTIHLTIFYKMSQKYFFLATTKPKLSLWDKQKKKEKGLNFFFAIERNK